MIGLEVGAALQGRFDEELQKGQDRVERAVQAAIKDYAADVQSRWRQDIAGSGLKNAGALAKTIRLKAYRNTGMDPAVTVNSNFPVIQHAFEQDTVVRSRNGFFIPIPNPDVWPTGRVPRPRRGGGRDNTIAIAEARFGPLRFVYRPRGASLLVAQVRQSGASAGAFRRASASALRRASEGKASGLTTIIVFFLVKEARLPRMLRGRVIRDRARRDATSEVGKRFVRFFEQDNGPRMLTDGGET